MTVKEIISFLDAKILCGENNLDKDVHSACGSDMMSDVLAFVKDQSLLITGLCNLQVIRTADMMDMVCICFIRGKIPDAEMIALAKELNIVLITSKLRMFSACGILYKYGLYGGETV